ncbi:hypothetical protein QEN19_003450 [Hanseniaspora menglaensis]
MQVKFKDLKKNIHSVECEPTSTISQLKESLATELKLDTATNDIKLIFSGTILKNEQTVADSKLVNESVVSFLIKKVKAKTPTPQTNKSTEAVTIVDPVSEPAAVQQTTTSEAEQTAVPTTTVLVDASSSNAVLSETAQASVSLNSETETAAHRQAANIIMELGYSEQQAMASLRMSNGDADRACEILMSGLLSEEQAVEENQQEDAGNQASGESDDDEDLFAAAANAVGGSSASRRGTSQGTSAAGDNQITLTMDDLVNLRQIANGDTSQLPSFMENMSQRLPQFNELIQSNPEMFLSMLLDSLQGNLGNLGGVFSANNADTAAAASTGAGPGTLPNIPPEMMNESFLKFASMIQQSGVTPETLLSSMNDPSFDPTTIPGFEAFAREMAANPEMLQQMASLMESQGGLEGLRNNAAAATARPAAVSPLEQLESQLSEEEKQSVNRLCELGFDRVLVIQIYLACDKNEEIAANMLFTEYAE